MKWPAIRIICLISAMLLLPPLMPVDADAIEDWELVHIWKANGAVNGVQEFRFGLVDWPKWEIMVRGASAISLNPSAQQKLMAQRVALVDAQRRMLYLLYELKYRLPRKIKSIEVQGQVLMGNISREGEAGGQYIVEIRAPLRQVLEQCVIWHGETQ